MATEPGSPRRAVATTKSSLWKKWLALGVVICAGAVVSAPTAAPAAQDNDGAAAVLGDQGIRGLQGDGWADVVIGQPSFTEVGPYEVVPFKLFNPAGLAVDTSARDTEPRDPGRLYVWDSGNSRILGVDLANCDGSRACRADVILGQQSDSTGACNRDSGFSTFPVPSLAGADTLCGVPQSAVSVLESKAGVALAVDAAGTLYVPDFYNHRVLAYESPTTTGAAADRVWGQADPSANTCNRGGGAAANTLCFKSAYADGAGAAIDSEGNLWVADGGNNRVLRFPVGPTGRPSTLTDLVLGQPDFASTAAGATDTQLSSPASVSVDAGGQVWVADRGNNRILHFTPPLASGMSGERFGHGFASPLHVQRDPAGNGVWVWDFGNGMYERWDDAGHTVEVVVGKATYTPDGACLSGLCPGAGSFAFDADGNLLVSAYGHVQDVIKYSRQSLDSGAPAEAGRLFSPPGGYNFTDDLRTAELGPVTGLAVGADQLIAGDGRRLLWWDGLRTLNTGQEPSGVLLTSDFGSSEAWQGRMTVDERGRLWVARAGAVYVFALPLRADASPIATILDGTIPVLGGGELTPGRYLHGIAVTPNGSAIWVADPAANRVFRVRSPLTAPLVDVVLGQTDPAAGTCNRGLLPPPKESGKEVNRWDVLCQPGSVALDGDGNLYVSDHTIEAEGNWRTLVFYRTTIPANNRTPIFAPYADTEFPYLNLQPAPMFEPAFARDGSMFVGFNAYVVGLEESATTLLPGYGRKVGIYDPLAANHRLPFKHLEEVASLPWSIKTDGVDNVYVADANRHRILVYWRPLGQAGPHRDHTLLLPIVVRRR